MRTPASGTRALAPTSPTIPSSYTPGPWHKHSHWMIGPVEGVVCQIWSFLSGNVANCIDQADADARLIAAAPELHQALVELMGDYRNDLAVIRPRTLKLIVSALAKVEGGAA